MSLSLSAARLFLHVCVVKLSDFYCFMVRICKTLKKTPFLHCNPEMVFFPSYSSWRGIDFTPLLSVPTTLILEHLVSSFFT